MNRVVAVAIVLGLAGVSGAAAQGKTQKIGKNLVNKAKATELRSPVNALTNEIEGYIADLQ